MIRLTGREKRRRRGRNLEVEDLASHAWKVGGMVEVGAGRDLFFIFEVCCFRAFSA